MNNSLTVPRSARRQESDDPPGATGGSSNERVEATTGFEPVNRGFADLPLRPLGYVALVMPTLDWLALEDSNLG